MYVRLDADSQGKVVVREYCRQWSSPGARGTKPVLKQLRRERRGLSLLQNCARTWCLGPLGGHLLIYRCALIDMHMY